MNLPATVLRTACMLALSLSFAHPLLAEDQAPATQPQEAEVEMEVQVQEADPQEPQMPSIEDMSYALGFTMASDMAQRNMGISQEQLMEGIAAGFGQEPPKLTEQQMAMCMFTFQMMMQQEQQQQMAQHMQDAQTNLAAGLAFLEAHAQEEGVTTTESGLQYKVITQGDGPTPTALDTVSAHYTGRLINGSVFDSSLERGPASFPVSRVIAGWTEALLMMKIGDKWELAIPADLAYGEEGRPGIPPNAVLLFEIELLGIE